MRALVLRGEGRAFCAGRDISGVDPRDDDVIGYLGGLVTPLLKRMSAFPAPTFAAAHGACLGVGLGLLIATDVVYVAESAPRSARRSPRSARRSTPAATRCSTSGSARTARSTSSTRGGSCRAPRRSPPDCSRGVFPDDEVVGGHDRRRRARRTGRDAGVPREQGARPRSCATSGSACGSRWMPRTPRRPRCATPTTTARASPPSRRSAPRSFRG